ncbi:heat-inducible transcriptional repressor HrcA [Mesomycoplasma bovoculi]|uniref:Heat-inducible transcription repressor HrcA n=1 Tax=Mesomycoplasma bovoculi M165/69 TaxID=743966 RepID=W5UZZ8_9BACT|nr:heat-inducible transcriptional repressor HrcA [Mesomycoplasma bovoculi]AHH45118.1 heat-inducible transcription repressor [Mesomycoplasma bovoculi M165/69]
MKSRLNEKKANYLKQIVEHFIQTGQPVGSANLKAIYEINKSTSHLRSMMNQLEQDGFLEKHHNSSGRVPTLKGFKYYAEFLSYDGNKELEKKLKDIFAKRRVNINETINEAVKIISEVAGAALITRSEDIFEKLMSISLTIINEGSGVVVLITSSGNVENKTIIFNDFIKKEDVKIAIRLFQERLVPLPISQISEAIQILKPVLENQIKRSEDILQHFLQNIFDFEVKSQSKVFNKNSLILNRDISRNKLVELLDIIEKKSIWEILDETAESEDETIKISIPSEEASFISKQFPKSSSIKEISVVGATKKMNYSATWTGIKLLEDFLNKKENKK